MHPVPALYYVGGGPRPPGAVEQGGTTVLQPQQRHQVRGPGWQPCTLAEVVPSNHTHRMGQREARWMTYTIKCQVDNQGELFRSAFGLRRPGGCMPSSNGCDISPRPFRSTIVAVTFTANLVAHVRRPYPPRSSYHIVQKGRWMQEIFCFNCPQYMHLILSYASCWWTSRARDDIALTPD